MRRMIFYSVMFVTVLLFLTAVPVYAYLPGYAVTFEGSYNVLYSIDLETATATRIGSTGIPYNGTGSGGNDIVEGLAIDKSGKLFAITANSLLYSVNVNTGAATLIGDTGRMGSIAGIDFLGDLLYGIDFNPWGNPASRRVFTINTADATTVDVVALSDTSISGTGSIAALNGSTMLFTGWLAPGTSYLFSVDLTTGVTKQIGEIKVNGSWQSVDGLDFGWNGTLYGIGWGGKVVQINPNTAAATVIGSTGSQFWLGLAIPDERPLGALPVSQCISVVEIVNPGPPAVTEKLSARVTNDFDGCIMEASAIFYKSSDCTGDPITPIWQDPDPNVVYKSGTRGGCAEAVEVTSSSPVCVELTLKSGRKTTVCY